ncbi:MAG: hypothetical protein OEV42_00685 [Deltaproteobacteria bacterium]|nr:hypothetical protein [Deltaproteobacteria bacterium]
MVKKYLPLLRDFDREISILPRSPHRLEAKKAIGTLLDFILLLQQSENLKGATTGQHTIKPPTRQRGPVKTDTVGAEYVKAGPLSFIQNE